MLAYKMPSVDEPEARLEETLCRSDLDLQTCRRLDWRFLLPDPRLRRVVYAGSGDGSLLAALTEFSDSLAVISSPCSKTVRPDNGAAFDLAVVSMWGPQTVETVSSLLVEGGSLYWEINRRNWFPPLLRAPSRYTTGQWRGLGLFRDYRGFLEQLGFCDIEMYWHHPDFGGCRRIIPLDSQSAIRYALASVSKGRVLQVGLGIARHAAGIRFLRHLAPCVSLVARKRAVDRSAI